MQHTDKYLSPLGPITLAEEDGKLSGLWFDGQKNDRAGLAEDATESSNIPVFTQAHDWLDAYFEGRDPGKPPCMSTAGTPFQELVWKELTHIPYGQTVTYGEIAQRIERRKGKPHASRAVGTAVGRNPISIMIPCHRVIGTDGSLTGYAGGIDRKRSLLELERSNLGKHL